MKTLLNGWIGKISLFRKRGSVLIESRGNGDHYSKVGVRNQGLGAWEVARCAAGPSDPMLRFGSRCQR